MKHVFRSLAIMLVMFSILLPEISSAETSGNSAALAAIKSELAAGRKKLKELAAKEGTQSEQLEQIRRDLTYSQTYLNDLETLISGASDEHRRLSDSLAFAQSGLALRQEAMNRRVRAMYKAGTPDILELFVTAGGLSDALRRLQYFKELARYDQMQLAALKKARDDVTLRSALVAQKEQKLLGLRTEKQQEQSVLETERVQQADILEGIRAEKQTYLTRVKQLEQSQKEMNALLKKLKDKEAKIAKAAKEAHTASLSTVKKKSTATAVRPATGFEKRRGTLFWPLSGPILKRYGKVVHPVYQTITMNSGIDIGAPRGTGVLCSAAGTVEYVGNMRGYGTFVIVNHGEGFRTIYAHLAKVAVKQDQNLAAGSQIALVGDGTSPEDKSALHFQVRHESETLDPLNWLSAH